MTITITIPPADELRVTTALGAEGTPATAADITGIVLGWISAATLTYERDKAIAEVASPPPLTFSA